MSRHERFADSLLLRSLAGLLLLAAGGLLGLALLAAQGGLPASGGFDVLAQLGELLLPLAGLALLALISLYDPLAALLAWLLLAPFSSHIPLDISLGEGIPDLSLTRLMAGLLLVLLAGQAVRGQCQLRPLGRADLAYALFGLAMLLTALPSRWGAAMAAQAILDAYLVPFLGLYIARQIVRDLRDLRKVTATLLLIGAILAFLIAREQITGEVLFYRATRTAAYSTSIIKVQSLMGNAAPMGVTTAMTLPLGLVALAQVFADRTMERSRRRLLLALLSLANGFIALGVFMTYNRASWLGAALAVLILVLLRPQARRLLLPVLLAAAIAALVFWQAVISSPAVAERLLEDNSINYRTISANLAFEMARRAPFLGIGYGNFGFEAQETYGWRPFLEFDAVAPSHNSYLFVLVSGGLAALLPYLAWFALIARDGWMRRRTAAGPARDALAAGLAVFLTYVLAAGAFDNAQTSYMNLLFFITLGAIWGATEVGGQAAEKHPQASAAGD